ncbi:MAG: hypothetical protein ISQ86_03190, partial [Alphaproteobacteria bacterium]|nr:hypothetical protein [Alphaproteobacteria bacterium]
ERLMAEEGWKWVAPASSLPADWHGWDQSKPKVTYTDEQKAKIAEYEAIMARTENDDTDAYPDARSAMESLQAKAAYDAMSPRQRAKSGVAVEIGAQGKLVRYFGLIKPEPKAVEPPPPAAAPTGKVIAADPAPLNEPEPEPRISGALATRLAAALTTASAQTLRADPNLALCVVIAGLMQNSSTAAVRLMHDGAGSRGLTWSDETFAKALGRVVRMKMDQRLKLLAEIAAASLSFHAHSAEHRALDDADTAAVVNAMNPKDLAKALKLAFDPDDYFKAVPKAMSATAIAEGMGKNAPDAETLAGMDKATLVETALREIPDTWLPAELRPLAYDGPAAKPKRKPSKAAKKKAKR